ncbi:MAG: sce7726 family protein [Oscillospiraceae bacterium]|nr:sce7726 family protein [Oscillospiraceae bacterium]
MPDNNRVINRVFTRKVMTDLIKNGHSEIFDVVVQRYINDPEDKNHGEIISEIYSHLGNYYRNEYYYMNTLLNKLLVGIHSVNTTTALSQIRIADHIADFVMINGEGQVYEIKSDLDNFERLNDQLYDYYKAFSKVSVLASESEREQVEKTLAKLGDMGDAVGIYVLSEKDTIFSKNSGRPPKQYDENLDYKCIFSLLRKKEYENIILQYYHELPSVAPVFFYKNCLELFMKIPILDAQNLALQELKKRNKISKIVFDDIPSELKASIYFSGLHKNMPELINMLNATYRR